MKEVLVVLHKHIQCGILINCCSWKEYEDKRI